MKNLYRFSTKPFEKVSETYYYGFRFYDAGIGRWLSKDPLGEWYGINLYHFLFNDSIYDVDILGERPYRNYSQAQKDCERRAKRQCGDRKILKAKLKYVKGSNRTSHRHHGNQIDVRNRRTYRCVIKCSKCTQEEINKRQSKKSKECNVNRGCSKNECDCNKLKKNIAQNKKCLQARRDVMECHDGGDAKHHGKFANDQAALVKCLQAYYKAGCN